MSEIKVTRAFRLCKTLKFVLLENGYALYHNLNFTGHLHDWTDLDVLRDESDAAAAIISANSLTLPLDEWPAPAMEDMIAARFRNAHLKLFLNEGAITQKTAILLLGHSLGCLDMLPRNPADFDPAQLALDARKFSHGELVCVQLILGVWNHVNCAPSAPKKQQWKCGCFDMINGVSVVAPRAKRVIADWLLNPWWC